MRLEQRLENIDFSAPFDLIVIGGGINGTGIARDAAERGLRVLLLEKSDFGSGCSAYSTRLIHGGLRYLENLEFNLVHESLQEREILLKNFPHLVAPIGLMLPSYTTSKVPLWKLELGMWLYDILSHGKSLKKHQKISANEIIESELDIDKIGLQGAMLYYDCQASFAERMCLENVAISEDHEGICLNHTEVSEICCEDVYGEYHIQSIKFKDNLNGKRVITAYAKNIINTAGPWVDKLNAKLKASKGLMCSAIKRLIGGTKGSHILVNNFKGAPDEFGIYAEAQSDGRPYFILPFQVGMNDKKLLIGTTDIFLESHENLDKLKTSVHEIDYLINETNLLFPHANLNRNSVLKTFIGVRPLPYKDNDVAGKVSRKHEIVNHSKDNIDNYFSIVGGKLTTFRSLSEEVVDMFTSKRTISDKKPSFGARFPDADFKSFIKRALHELCERYDVESSTVMHLIKLYGARAEEVLKLAKINPSLFNKVHENFEDIEAQIVYAIRYEKAYTIEDILLRRLSIGLCVSDYPVSVINTVNMHIKNEFDLQGRIKDKEHEKVLISDFGY